MRGSRGAGLRTLMIDVGVLGDPAFAVDISAAHVAAAAKGKSRRAPEQRETVAEV